MKLSYKYLGLILSTILVLSGFLVLVLGDVIDSSKVTINDTSDNDGGDSRNETSQSSWKLVIEGSGSLSYTKILLNDTTVGDWIYRGFSIKNEGTSVQLQGKRGSLTPPSDFYPFFTYLPSNSSRKFWWFYWFDPSTLEEFSSVNLNFTFYLNTSMYPFNVTFSGLGTPELANYSRSISAREFTSTLFSDPDGWKFLCHEIFNDSFDLTLINRSFVLLYDSVGFFKEFFGTVHLVNNEITYYKQVYWHRTLLEEITTTTTTIPTTIDSTPTTQSSSSGTSIIILTSVPVLLILRRRKKHR